MTAAPHTLLAAGDRLPAGLLHAVDGRRVDLHLARDDSVVLVFPHPRCEACAGRLAELDAVAAELAGWDGRPAVVVTDVEEAHEIAERVSFPVLVDPRGRTRTAAGVVPDGAAVLVADRYGTVYRADPIDADHRFPTADELATEVRYIAIQCPECSVPELSDPATP